MKSITSIAGAISIVMLLLITMSCETFQYSPYEIDIKGERDFNLRNIAKLVETGADTTYIAMIGDTQRFYASTQVIINKINNLPHVDFVVHVGDIVDFGLQREYDWILDLLETLNPPCIAVSGNHDLIGNGQEIYQEVFGPLDFSFKFNGDKFIYVNTNSREFGFELDVPNVPWLTNELGSGDFDDAIIVQHIPPFHEDFNDEFRYAYYESQLESGKVLLNLAGHTHIFNYQEPFEGLGFLNAESAESDNFVFLKLWDGGYSYEQI